MTVKAWALRPRELKSLSRAGQLRLAARCAMRVEPWMPSGARSIWKKGLDHVLKVALAGPVTADELARGIDDKGLDAGERLGVKDELRAECVRYSMLTLATAVQAAALDGRELTKGIIDVAKYSASIAALLAHGGRVKVGKGKDPVEVACLAMWGAIRADIAIMATAPAKLDARAVRALAPLWPGKTPAWVARGVAR
jgi:hypothetical protein